MKKYLLLLLLLLLPVMVNAKENVEITNIELTHQSDYAEIVNDATAEGLKINFDIKFSKEKDSVEYKITIKNNDSKDYELQEGKTFDKNEYITYEVKYSGDNKIKANSTKEATIIITYAHEVPVEKLVNGKYEYKNQMSIDLSNNVENPKTTAKILIIALITVLLVVGTIIVLSGSTKAKLLTILVVALIPITTLAISKITITVDSKVVIEREGEFCYNTYDPQTEKPVNKYFKFLPGMSWQEYLESDYNQNYFSIDTDSNPLLTATITYKIPNHFYTLDYYECLSKNPVQRRTTQDRYDLKCDETGNDYNIGPDSKIQLKSKGCYTRVEIIDNVDNFD